jgi:hypothetical protein
MTQPTSYPGDSSGEATVQPETQRIQAERQIHDTHLQACACKYVTRHISVALEKWLEMPPILLLLFQGGNP